jgi:hypothetical protein
MRMLRFSTPRFNRESGMIGALRQTEAWNSRLKEHLEAVSKVTSCGADFWTYLEFMETHAAHDEDLWKEYIKPRWVRLPMDLYGGEQHAFANFFNEFCALKEGKSQRLVIAYGAGSSLPENGSTPAPSTQAFIECAKRFVTVVIVEFRTTCVHHELGCTLQKVRIGTQPPSSSGKENHGERTEQPMPQRALVRGLLLLDTTVSAMKRSEFVNRDFNAAMNIRRCALLKTRPPELTRANFEGSFPGSTCAGGN